MQENSTESSTGKQCKKKKKEETTRTELTVTFIASLRVKGETCLPIE